MNNPSSEELRKIQLTGGSTFIVSLPKGWVEKVGLGRGSVVSITQLDDLTLCLQPKDSRKEEDAKKAIITVTDEISPENLTRRVISAYLVGYNIIQLRNPSKRIDSSQRYAVKDFTRKKLVGTEILSDLPRELTLQVLLSHTELSVKDALRRMSIIAASMHRDAMGTLVLDDSQLAKEIVAMDDEVDRFGLYIIRLLKAAVVNASMLREIGLGSPRESLGYRLITKSVERMADHAVKIAVNSLALTLAARDEEILSELGALSDTAVGAFEASVDSLFEGDYSSAEVVMSVAEEGREREAEIIQKIIKSAPPSDVPALRLILESILRTAEYGADIAEVVLNMTVESEIRRG
jgi:phosphate uptake regulator